MVDFIGLCSIGAQAALFWMLQYRLLLFVFILQYVKIGRKENLITDRKLEIPVEKKRTYSSRVSTTLQLLRLILFNSMYTALYSPITSTTVGCVICVKGEYS